jgi:hypothetical protein
MTYCFSHSSLFMVHTLIILIITIIRQQIALGADLQSWTPIDA